LERAYPRAILFDLDDTILAVNINANKCWRYVCNVYANHINGLSPDELLSFVQKSRAWYWSDPDRVIAGLLKHQEARRIIVNRALGTLGINDTLVGNAIADSFGDELDSRMEPFPGAVETLHHLRNNNVRMALLTNGSSALQRMKIEKFNLGWFFDTILIQEEMGYAKPDERFFRQALNHLKVDEYNTWMVGDDLVRDIAGAQKLGIFSYWVESRTGLPREVPGVTPDRVIQSVAELVQGRICTHSESNFSENIR
jgi:putative hydrolase of the HAD superfamily